MRTDMQLRLMAMTLRGLCASRCQIMRFNGYVDNFAERWESLSQGTRDEWVALANILDTLYQGDLFRKDIPGNTNEPH